MAARKSRRMVARSLAIVRAQVCRLSASGEISGRCIEAARAVIRTRLAYAELDLHGCLMKRSEELRATAWRQRQSGCWGNRLLIRATAESNLILPGSRIT